MPVSMSAAIDSRGISCHSRYSDSGVLSGDSGMTGATATESRIRSLVPNDWMRHCPASPVWFKMALLGTGAPLHSADSIRISFNQFFIFVTKGFVFDFDFLFIPCRSSSRLEQHSWLLKTICLPQSVWQS
jgi:hypothetical protein